MRSKHTMRGGAAVWAAALAIAAGACNTGDRDMANQDATPGAVASGGAGDESPVTLTGCLQQGDGSDFILTQVNERPGPIATSGENESPEVQQKQQEAAARSYRLSGGPDNLRDMVGHQVRVTGTIEDRADLPQREGEQQPEADIDAGDLAEVEVTAAESVAATCSNAGGPSRN